MYPSLTKENKIAGLEFVDFLALVGVYVIVFIFSKNIFVNIGFVFMAYLFLAFYKHKKPPRYTHSLLRFIIKPARYTQAYEVSL